MDQTTLQLGRVMSVAISGLFSYVLLYLVFKQRLKDYLAVNVFGGVVLTAGALLAILVALKLYGQFSRRGADATCDHDHGHEGHSHDHGVSLWRLMVLVFPLMLLLAGVVPTKLTAQAMAGRLSGDQKRVLAMNIGTLPPERSKITNWTAEPTTLPELMTAVRDSSARGYWESTEKPVMAQVVGEFVPNGQYRDRYQLMQSKMTCCTADATPVTITILGVPDPAWTWGHWIEVTGALTFPADSKGGRAVVLHQNAAAKLPAPPSDIYVR